ncbi:MAG TPA: tetratricopeptide repeat protein, partial [Ktedonobacteraceae bacterium]|nr:tetratricopeptide repeat protein [Ktedonobacteraceae bacterium]
MVDVTSPESLLRGMRPEIARRRIDSFGRRFGPAHLYLAQHAALLLALTPDVLYRLWAEFQQDIYRKKRLNIPWVAVADLLLSSLCNEVGYELYEMDVTVRAMLLSDLTANPDFGVQRRADLSRFLLGYVQQQLHSPDPDVHDFACVQQWTALAYTNPIEAGHELAKAFANLDQSNRAEMGRIASLVEILAEPLARFTDLHTYARSIGYEVRGDTEQAVAKLASMPSPSMTEQGASVRVLGVDLPIPTRVREQLRKEASKAGIPEQKTKEQWKEEGNVHFNAGRYEAALATYEQALRSDPNSAVAYTGKGNALRRLNRKTEALEAYEQALRLDANYAAAYAGKGDVLGRLNRSKEALENYEQALQLDANLAAAYMGKGDVLDHLNRRQEALVAYQQAISHDANLIQAYSAEGEILNALGRTQEARTILEKALQAFERAIQSSLHLVDAYLGKGNA